MQRKLLFSVTVTVVGITTGITTSIQKKEHKHTKIHRAIIDHLKRIKLVKKKSSKLRQEL